MSYSLIEAKFMMLDSTIKMLSKSNSLRTPKVASSDQLRELLETQKATSLLPTLNPIKGEVEKKSKLSYLSIEKRNRSRPNTAREVKSEKKLKHSLPRPSTGRRDTDESSAEIFTEKWVDPKQRRAEQLLQDTWHEIDSAVNWGQALGSSTQEAPQSKLLTRSKESQDEESTQSELQPQEQYLNDQTKADTALSAAVHNALPVPKRPMTSTGLRSKKSKAYLSTRCRSASSHVQPKNWFAPSTIDDTRHSPKPKRKINRQRPVTSDRKQAKTHQNNDQFSPPLRSEPRPQARPENEVVCETEMQRPQPVPKPDDPSFYMLELRLVHPTPLTNWRFQASFTDISVNPAKTVILEDLTADEENYLIFDDFQSTHKSSSSRYFNPFCYFLGLKQPSDLYGHVLRIVVTALQPVTRIVIDTSVQFTRFPDEAVVEPGRTLLDAVVITKPEVSPVRVQTRRTSSAPSVSMRKRNLSKARPRQQRIVNNNEDSTTSLAKDQCSPWSSSDQGDFSSDSTHDILGQLLNLCLDESRPPSSIASPRKDPSHHLDYAPLTTIDKKKMQLQRLRATIRREMREQEKVHNNFNIV